MSHVMKTAALLIGVTGFAGAAAAQSVQSRVLSLIGANQSATGTVSLTEAPHGVLVRIEANGLTPGWHAVHFHSVANCGDVGFKAAAGHVHATGAASVHGLLNAGETDVGDLPNIFAATDGSAHAEIFAPSVTLGSGAGRMNLLDTDGSAIVIHASPDDHSSQPIGGAGARVACAVIR